MSRRLELSEVQRRDLIKDLGIDRLPVYIKDKRVTELMDLRGKKAVVTGAGGAGLGQACANRLAGLGADVALVDINLEGARRVAAEVAKRWGTKAVAIEGNVVDWDSVHRFIRESHDKLGGIDILVNNAAPVDSDLFEKQTKEQMEYTFRGVVLSGAFCSRAALDYMIPQRSGRIINVSSEGGRTVHRNLAFYDACKAAVIHFTRTLAHEVSHHGIYVLGVCPGIMMNPNLRASLESPTEKNRTGWESMLDGFAKTELGRVSMPEEVANMVAFLASDAASFMQGVSVSMGGGQA